MCAFRRSLIASNVVGLGWLKEERNHCRKMDGHSSGGRASGNELEDARISVSVLSSCSVRAATRAFLYQMAIAARSSANLALVEILLRTSVLVLADCKSTSTGRKSAWTCWSLLRPLSSSFLTSPISQLLFLTSAFST